MSRAGRVLAVEVDSFLVDKLRASLATEAPTEEDSRLEVRQDDFLALPLPTGAYKVVGNVPYAITTDIVRKLTATPTPPLDAWLVVQREFGQPLCGPPYGRESLFSLSLKPAWHVEIVARLQRADFDPPPSIESVLLWLSRRERALLDPAELSIYQRLTGSAYQSRRSLQDALKPWVSKVQLRRLGRDLRFAAQAEPSSLSFEQWLGILRFVCSRDGVNGTAGSHRTNTTAGAGRKLQ
jgi:23S rRNA (adenine-N6)-dimethyltransferase